MRLFSKSILFTLLLLPALLLATVTDLQLFTPSSIQSNGDVGFTYSSTEDTVHSVIYLETEGNQTLNTANDRFFYHIIQIDNDTASNFQDKIGYLGDANDTTGRYSWFVPQIGLPAGLWWVYFYDKTGFSVDTFRVLPISNPYRTISGNVTAPVGRQKSFIQVNADLNQGNSRFSAFTDTAGDYTIAMDSATLVSLTDTIFMVRPDAVFAGFMANPADVRVDVRAASVTGIDFVFDSITSGVRVTVLSGSSPLPGVKMGLSDSTTWSEAARGQADSAGFCLMGTAAGTYYLNFDNQSLAAANLLSPSGIIVHVLSGQFVDTTIVLESADTAIFGRLTKDGGNPGGNYRIDLRSDAGNSEAVVDSNGYFRLPASSSATRISVSLVTWDNKYDTIPAGYYIEAGTEIRLQIGDYAAFDIVPVPKGAVHWQVTNSGTYTPTFYNLMLWKVNSTTQELDTALAYAMDLGDPSDTIQTKIKDGVYYAQVTAYVPSRGTYIQKFLAEISGALTPVTVNNDTPDVVMALTNDDTLDGTGKHGTVKVRASYSGACSTGNVTHGLKSSTGSFNYYIAIGISDSNTFDYVVPGWYKVFALIDTNHDGIIEAFSGQSMLFVAPDSNYDLTQVLVDRPSGPGGISGTLAYTGSAFPSNCRVRVVAQMIDSTLADGAIVIDEKNMAFNAYAVDLLSAPSAYSFSGLPEGQYIVFAEVDSSHNIPEFHRDTLEQGFYGIGSLASRLYTRVRVEAGVTSGIDFKLGEPDLATEKSGKPVRFALNRPSPNPFNPTVNLRFDVPRLSFVTLGIYDISGRLVAKLVNDVRGIGSHIVTWSANAGQGRSVASGIYIVRMQAGSFTAKQKLVFLK